MAGKTEKVSINERLNDFIQKNRKVLIIGLGSIIAAVIVLVAVFVLKDSLQSQALSKVEELQRRYEAVRYEIGSEGQETAQREDINILLNDLSLFERNHSGYAAARAYAISASIYEGMQNWQEAENAWASAAKAGVKTYIAPVAFYNAAVAAEELGNINGAIELYNKALENEKAFPAAPRAQFSIGRLQESQGNNSSALVSYLTLVSKLPQDQIWANLAQSRILALTIDR